MAPCYLVPTFTVEARLHSWAVPDERADGSSSSSSGRIRGDAQRGREREQERSGNGSSSSSSGRARGAAPGAKHMGMRG